MYASLTFVAQGNNFLKIESSEEKSSIIFYPQDDAEDWEEHTVSLVTKKSWNAF